MGNKTKRLNISKEDLDFVYGGSKHTQDGSLKRHLEENYNKKELEALFKMLRDEELTIVFSYFLEGALSIEDVHVLAIPYEDLPLDIFKSINDAKLNKILIKWRLNVGH